MRDMSSARHLRFDVTNCFFLTMRPPPISTLFPYTTLFRSNALHTKRQNLFQELDAVIHLLMEEILSFRMQGVGMPRSEERFSRNAETDIVCRLLLEKKKNATGCCASYTMYKLENHLYKIVM